MAESKNVDLRKEYGAPFAIFSRDEGSRYTSLLSRDFNPPRCLDFQLLRTHRWTDAIDAHCRTLSFENIVKMKHTAYHQLTLQFYTTLNFKGDGGFSCRLMGKSVTVTRKTLCDVFGFREGGHESVPKDFDRDGFWREISGNRGDFSVKKTPSAFIKDPIFIMMHRYISHVVFGRVEVGTVSVEGLFYLWCLSRRVYVATPCFLLATFKSVITVKRRNMCLGNFITAIAVYFGAFDPLVANMTVLHTRAIGLAAMRDAFKKKEGSSFSVQDDAFKEKHESSSSVQDDETDVTPPVDTWKLISREAEQLQALMNDGCNDLEASFDGLEKKFTAMCRRFQTFKQELRDLRDGKSNKTIGKLSMEVKKIKESLAKISSMKVADLANLLSDMRELDTFDEGNGNRPDDTELFPGVQLASNSIGSKVSSKNGDRNSPQPCIGEFDIAHIVPQPGSDEFMEPLGSSTKSEVRKCLAARDIIEILDSDDETVHTGAAKSSENVSEFMYEADMLRAFQHDDELCLNAVCALYRQKFKNGGFSSVDSLRGCALAEYLIDGDKELRLTRSVSQLKRQQPDVIARCRKLATIYVRKLFDIYCAGVDPLFCQP